MQSQTMRARLLFVVCMDKCLCVNAGIFFFSEYFSVLNVCAVYGCSFFW